MNANRISDDILPGNYKDGDKLMHTDLNRIVDILKAGVNANFSDILTIMNGKSEASFGLEIEQTLDQTGIIPVQPIFLKTFNMTAAGLKQPFYWDADEEEIKINSNTCLAIQLQLDIAHTSSMTDVSAINFSIFCDTGEFIDPKYSIDLRVEEGELVNILIPLILLNVPDGSVLKFKITSVDEITLGTRTVIDIRNV